MADALTRFGAFIAQKEVFDGMMVEMKAMDVTLRAQLRTRELHCRMARRQFTIGHEP